MPEQGIQKNPIEKKKKTNGCLVVFLVIVGVIIIGVLSSSGSKNKSAETSKKEMPAVSSSMNQVSSAPTSQETSEKKAQTEAKMKQIEKEMEYRTKIIKICQTILVAQQGLRDFLLKNPFPPSWTDSETAMVADWINTMRESYEDTKYIQAPEELKEQHQTFLRGMKYYNDGIEELVKGLALSDSSLIEQATKTMNKGADLLSEVR
ncbi:MAG: hypothetical protein PHY72_02695 [Candidatus Pacebacteria bacterium]|nr:hypothetical protein [Candidatus Paceibacterota bacterium]